MNRQVYVVRPDGTGMRRLTGGGTENTWLGFWILDGRTVALSSNRRSLDAVDGYFVDIETGEMTLVAETRGVGLLTDVSRDGRRAIVWHTPFRGDSDLFLIDPDTGAKTLLTPHDGLATFRDGRLSHDGQFVYLASNGGRDQIAFARMKLSGEGLPDPIEILSAREDAELQEFALTGDGMVAALVWNVAGRSELTMLDLAALDVLPGPRPPGDVCTDLAFSKDGRLLALTISGPASPSNIWVVERDSGRFSQITHSPRAGVDSRDLSRPELVQFAAHDGVPLSGWLYRPRGHAGPGPAVLSFHGGPEGQERPGFTGLYQALLAQGIAVFAPNVRGSGGFGNRFVNLDNGPMRINAIRDIKTCYDFLLAGEVAVAGRIGIMGGSYGGYMVMVGLTEYPDLFAAGANLYGMVNFETFFAHTEPWMAAISKIEYGDPKLQPDVLRSLSPIHKIDRVKAPTLVLHGAHDTNVPVIEAEQVVENLGRLGVPVEYILFPDEGHGFVRVRNRIRAAGAIVRWFTRYLKGGSWSGM